MLDEALQPELPQNSLLDEVLPDTVVTLAPVMAAIVLPGETIAAPEQISPPPARDVTSGSGAAAHSWRPLLQVDRVVWPSIHNRLQAAAPASVEQMTDSLQSIGDSGRRLIGLTSCARGEGVTTLLLAAARKLLERGRKVAVVDGNWGNPQLARSLGLLPQVGWEESLCRGLPLEEIVIESAADGLAILPVREGPSALGGVGAPGTPGQAAITAGLDILAREFDFVLVDLAPLDEIGDAHAPARGVLARMDAVVLVQNLRVTHSNRLAEVRQRLTASNLRFAGTIQNFVAG